ncbi:uncharacterized protein K444DRAFT_661563 [Hyaloscypha bicolor E]|uniref:Uncharacterized protein n=1 Tax=Hyaloscypha bicolor E TaxID=1095630 RepID=A0A2J6TH81_9HELO|nr:uncharacterized protein K444DRAFT_661563 [Hyaloscypha bicolor E]PMD62377.1 hypothetical protein K444DRAFT_661563 [Hyaloscypha bicolor E]
MALPMYSACISKFAIDTGNLQGNIVSRDFVEKVPDLPSSSFEKLTKEEESRGTGITGESHIPLGAIQLTWYHKNSTRVFRDMQFFSLASPHCDLIIGAWSIQKEKILDIPCLAVKRPSIIILPNWPRHKDEPDLDELNHIDGNIKTCERRAETTGTNVTLGQQSGMLETKYTK